MDILSFVLKDSLSYLYLFYPDVMIPVQERKWDATTSLLPDMFEIPGFPPGSSGTHVGGVPWDLRVDTEIQASY